MSVARARALTPTKGRLLKLSSAVEMSIARARALTPVYGSVVFRLFHVEMSVARARALTHYVYYSYEYRGEGRNECCPCEGIDTLCHMYITLV